MKLIRKDEIDGLIGKSSFWMPKKNIGSCEYVAGIEELDEILGNQNFFKVKPLINFLKHEDGLEISIMNNFKLRYLGLKKSQIKNIFLERGKTIDIENRSIISRAVAGGLILGPIGAIIGGMTGLKDKIIKENDNILIILAAKEKEQALLFEVKKGKTPEIIKYFKENYPTYFSIN